MWLRACALVVVVWRGLWHAWIRVMMHARFFFKTPSRPTQPHPTLCTCHPQRPAAADTTAAAPCRFPQTTCHTQNAQQRHEMAGGKVSFVRMCGGRGGIWAGLDPYIIWGGYKHAWHDTGGSCGHLACNLCFSRMRRKGSSDGSVFAMITMDCMHLDDWIIYE